MFPPMQRKPERALPPEEALTLLSQADHGILSLASTDNGYPYGVPLNHMVHNGTLYFHSGMHGLKVSLIERNPKACYTVITHARVVPKILSTAYTSVIAFGQVRELADDEKTEMLRAFAHHFSSAYPTEIEKHMKALRTTRVYAMTLDHVTGKRRNDKP